MTMYSVQQIAEAFKCTGQAVRKAIKERRINATKVGYSWIISEEELNRLKERGHLRREIVENRGITSEIKGISDV